MTEPVIPRRLTSGVPASPELSLRERLIVAQFDAAPDAEESLRERVAAALDEFVPLSHPATRRNYARFMADAAIAVIRGDDA